MVKGVGQVQLRIVMLIFQVDQRFGIDSRVQFRHLQEGMDLAMVCMVIIPGIDLQMSHLLKTWLALVCQFVCWVPSKLCYEGKYLYFACYLILNFCSKLILRGRVALLVTAVLPKDLSYQAAVQTLLVNQVKAALADCS
jgi:hypothetical protein